MSGSLEASGAQLTVTVRNADGAPLADAVVTARMMNGATRQAPIPAKPLHINQHNTAYIPFVTVIPSGTAATFVNSDLWGHHVYSFSKSKRFEVTIAGETESKQVVFDKPGIVVIGCNIHDRMLAYIYVSGDGVSAKSDKTGVVRFPTLKDGAYNLTAWHPLLASKRKQPAVEVSVNNEKVTDREIVLKLKRPKKKKKKRY
ncbi:MAG: methylamine utilization protein [Rhodospirillaceae bacterium]|nr:methylamine utilization protein [Rhodospirillaceae bacterium]MBT5667870.1 methylamine utilization protein [Rhodospirillaceae bacterium]